MRLRRHGELAFSSDAAEMKIMRERYLIPASFAPATKFSGWASGISRRNVEMKRRRRADCARTGRMPRAPDNQYIAGVLRAVVDRRCRQSLLAANRQRRPVSEAFRCRIPWLCARRAYRDQRRRTERLKWR